MATWQSVSLSAGRAIQRLPLLISGGTRRFAEDPWRGVAAVSRAVPVLGRVLPDPTTALARVERAAAEDRLDDAVSAAREVTDPVQQVAADLAIRRLSGHLREVADVRPVSRAQRRQVQAARREAAVLRSALPTWAARHREVDDAVDHQPGHRLRVMHVVTNSLPRVQAGSTIRTHRIARTQQEEGWEVTVATRPGFPVFHGDVGVPGDRVYDGVRYLSLLPWWMPAPEAIPSSYAALLGEQVDRWRPDVVHGASDHINGRAALQVGRRRGLPVAYEARTLPEDSWLSRHGGESARNSDTYRWMRERHLEVMLAADAVTTLGEAMRHAICEQGVDPTRVFIVPNGVPDDYLTTPTPTDEARSRLGIEGGEILLGTVTTMYSYEGLETLVDTAGVLRSRGVDARLLLVGDGPQRERLIALAGSLGVPYEAPGRVPVTEVPGYLDALDVFVLPRRDDAITATVTALKPLEAQARGIPVVGSDLPAVAEVLAPGSTLVVGSDPHDWAEAVTAYLDPHHRHQSGLRAREWVRACRTWPSVMAGYRSAYAFVGVVAGE